MIRTLLAITLFTSTACSDIEDTSGEQDNIDVSQQLLEVLAGMPNGTITASATFDGDDAEVEYTWMGETSIHPMTGTASISLTHVDGMVVLTGFDTLVEDFVINSSFNDPTAPVTTVNVSNTTIVLADEDGDGTVIEPLEVTIDPSGTATAFPFLSGQAHFDTSLGSIAYTTVEELSDPVIAVFGISDDKIQLSVDYEYSMNVELLVSVPITFRVHYDVVVPLL